MTSDLDSDRPSSATGRPEPDAHGQAALLLAESMLHALVETRTLSLQNAIDVLQTTAEVKVEVAEMTGESSARMQESLTLLLAIRTSFESDAPPPRPRLRSV